MRNVQLFVCVGVAMTLATTATSAAQDRSISGSVRNLDGNAIGGIALILGSVIPDGGTDDTVRRITVSADGSFTGTVPEGDHRVIGISPPCFAAHDLTLDESGLLKLLLKWQPSGGGEDGPGGTTATLNIGFSARPTTVNLFRIGNPVGIGAATQGIRAGLSVIVTRTPNGGGIAVDPQPDCEKWKPAAQ